MWRRRAQTRLFSEFIFSAVLAANVLSWSFAWSLTIYRIGGDALSPAEEGDSDEVVVVPLSWEGFAQGPGGQTEGLEVKTGQLRPKFITPDENLALAATSRGGGPFGVRHQGEDSSGRYGWVWDGLGDDGRSVLPGLYLYRVQVDADGGREERSGLIPVVR